MGLKRVLISLVFLCFTHFFVLQAQQAQRSQKAKSITSDSTVITERKPEQRKGAVMREMVSVPEISLSEEEALKYLEEVYSSPSMWKRHNEPLRDELGVLLYHYQRPPFDTTVYYLSSFPFDSIRIPWRSFYIIDSVKITVPFLVSDTAATDTAGRIRQPEELYLGIRNSLKKIKLSSDLTPIAGNDTLAINDSVYVLLHDFIPAALPPAGGDTTILIISDTLSWATLSDKRFPFRRMRYPFMTDSIKGAISTLVSALELRDSTKLFIAERDDVMTDVWLNSQSGNLRRFWLHDMNGDSVTVWIGSPSRNVISLQAEEGVTFKRPAWHNDFADTKVNTVSANDEALRKVTLNKLDPNIWKYRGDISFIFSQLAMSDYWVSGGNGNISTTLDLNGYLYYTNKETNLSWTTSGRLAVGLIKSEDVDLKKNLDIIDITSKINHKAFGKFDFSGQFQFKTQSFPSRKNDTILVSKFFNPATLIIGYGLDYKPTKKLSINVSPVSYKGIFVPDAGEGNDHVDGTQYGLDKGKRSKNEMGMYVTINSTDKIFKKITMTNKVQFFSNFLNKPQNVDIDWEMTMTTSLSWFADIKINTFLIYDDETLFPIVDKDKKPVLDANGNQVKSPRVQFKELLGLTLLFRF